MSILLICSLLLYSLPLLPSTPFYNIKGTAFTAVPLGVPSIKQFLLALDLGYLVNPSLVTATFKFGLHKNLNDIFDVYIGNVSGQT